MYYCVVSWNERTEKPDSFYMCSKNRNNANRLKHRMDDRGRKRIRVIKRKSAPRGVEPVRAAMARWGLKPSLRMIKGRKNLSGAEFSQAMALARRLKKAGTSATDAMPRVVERFGLKPSEARSIRRAVWGAR